MSHDGVSCFCKNNTLDIIIQQMRKDVAEIEELKEKNEQLHEQVQEMIDDSGQECGCGYDRPDDVCLGHWPKYKKQLDKIDRLSDRVNSLEASLSNSVNANWYNEKIEQLRNSLTNIAARLAAAISLLEGGGQRAAPSNKMFDQMLVDYKKALNNARDILAATEDGK